MVYLDLLSYWTWKGRDTIKVEFSRGKKSLSNIYDVSEYITNFLQFNKKEDGWWIEEDFSRVNRGVEYEGDNEDWWLNNGV